MNGPILELKEKKPSPQAGLQAQNPQPDPWNRWLGFVVFFGGLLLAALAFVSSAVYGWWKPKQPVTAGAYTVNFWGLSPAIFLLVIGAVLLLIFGIAELWRIREGKPAVLHFSRQGNAVPGTAIVAIVLFALAGFALLRNRANNQDKNIPSDSIEDIQSAFRPPQQPATSTPPLALPQPAAVPEAAPTRPRSQIRGNAAARAPQAARTTTYRSEALRFQLTLSPSWQAQQTSGNSVAFTSSGGQQASIQAYGNVPDSLTTVAEQLRGSTAIKSVSNSSFQGSDALAFTTTFGQHGLAFIRNNRLYYLMADSITTSPLAGISFF